MFIFKVRIIWLQFWRAVDIILILLRQGFYEFAGRKKWLKPFRPKDKPGTKRIHTTEERIRSIIEDLGPTFIKFGQILADRPDLVSETLRRELKFLQSKARPIDDDICLSILEKELGAVEHIFAEFDKKHIASASIAQAYKAVLHTGEKVVVKIQRPHVESKIKLDLILMKLLTRKLIRDYPYLANIGLEDIIEEFGETIIKELNYLNEANNIFRFGEMFRGNPDVFIPKVFTELCTRKVLVLEYIDGIPPDETPRLREEGYDLKVIANNGANAILQMIFVHGYFHADPHPGNIFIMRNNVVGFIDFGMVGALKPAHMDFLAGFILGFARRDPKTITRALLRLSGKKFYEYSEELEFDVEELIKRNSYLPYEKVDFSQVLTDCVNMILKYNLKLPSSIYLLLKALGTIQRFAEKLEPEMSFSETILPYAKEMVKKKYAPKNVAGDLYNAIGDYVRFVRNFPVEVNAILGKMRDGKLIHEINLHDDKGASRVVKSFSRRIALALLIGTLIVCSTILITSGTGTFYARALFAVSTFTAIVLVLKYVFGSNR